MNNNLVNALKEMEDWEFFLLEHHMYIARQVRNTISKNGLTAEQMAGFLEVDVKDMKAIVNGSYEFNLRFMAKLQAYNEKIAAQNAKFKIEAEQLQFAGYKDKHPKWVIKVEELCELVKQHLKGNTDIKYKQ